jgi:hypothetical protein
MSFSLAEYAKIKNNYCVCYIGPLNEYVLQLNYLRPAIEKELPGINMYVCCKESLKDLAFEQKIIFYPKIKEKRKSFGHIYEIACNVHEHPILKFLEESNLSLIHLTPPIPILEESKKCCILPNGTYPTKSLNKEQVNTLKNMAELKGYYVEINKPEGAGWIIGVENEEFFKAAIKGIKTSLVPTGLGKKLYLKLFPQGTLLNI